MTTVSFDQVSKKFRQHHAGAPDDDLWALRDITFACGEGEVLGLVGRNGCGKSTLLKLAAGVTSPTNGIVTCAKPVAPMLELGAGFHRDLTGRDNIQLNGCLLGMGWRIKPSLIEEIVAFAELEQHVDTPVKHYSSGMYARLGFAVAVHSPARVLLVDEVLSVGDQLFQEKCFTRMKQLRDCGTTIILVSHNDWWIRNFCSRVLVMEAGRMIADTRPEDALQIYEWRLRGLADGRKSGFRIAGMDLCDLSGKPVDSLDGTSLRVRIEYEASGAPGEWVFVIRVRREDGVECATCIGAKQHASGAGVASASIAGLSLGAGQYFVEVSIEDAASLTPLATPVSKGFTVPGDLDAARGYQGVIKILHQWTFE